MGHSKNDKFIAPLSKARNLGSAHEGVHHWMHERITSVILVPLVFWIVYSIVNLQGASYLQFTAWMQNPINAVLLISLIAVGFYHAAIGLQVIIEDYISSHSLRLLKIIAVKIGFGLMALATIFSILKIAL